ncbi:MAG: S8 family peptidase [Elusimicrobia bacterium]|nr:S8 family peptidase [Elusimicrobiota bacterium]
MKLLALLLAFAPQAFAGQKMITFAAGVGTAEQARTVESRGGRVLRSFPFINGLLAEFPDAPRSADISRAPGVDSAEDDEDIYWLAGEAPVTLEEAQAELYAAAREQAAVEVSTPAPVSPPYITTSNAEGRIEKLPWSAGRLQVTRAWKMARGAGARVAVLDTGADCSHPDLAPNCLPGYNVITPGAEPFDDKGHGTHVSGIIAGALNWSGMAGIAPEAKIIPVKVLNSSGTGKVSQIIEGMEWAVAQRPDVMNMSLGSQKFSAAQGKAVKAARAAGILVVCAAGNDGGPVGYPAAFEDAVAVSALDFSNKLASFSSRGPEIDFTEPGVRIFSAFPGGSFRLISGTSQAAPHVSGLAALAAGLGVRGETALRQALGKASYNLGLPAEEQGAGAPVASYLVNNILSGK